jgi:hypothetical protein
MESQRTTAEQRAAVAAAVARAQAYAAARLRARGDPATAAGQRLSSAVPFLPELGAAWSAGLRSVDDMSSGRAADFGTRWNEARGEQQGYADQFQQDHPLVGNLLGALGLAAPGTLASAVSASRGAGLAAAPAAQLAPAAVRGLVPTLRRTAGSVAQNATGGALAGAAYGFSRPGTVDQRLDDAKNAFLPGALGGAIAPLAARGLTRAGASLLGAPAAVAAIRRSLSGAPLTRTLDDLDGATGVDLHAALGDTAPLAQSLNAKHQGPWTEVNELPAPVTTNDILESPEVIGKYGSVMDDMEDEGKSPLREIPVANDYYSPIRGHFIPDFLLQLPTVGAVDATRRQLLDDVWRRYGASGRLDLDAEGETALGSAKTLADLLSSGPDLTGQAYRRAFGASGDELSLKGAFQSAQGKIVDPTLDPDEYGAWFSALRPFEQDAARAAAANDILGAVNAGRSDVFASPLVQRRMETAFGPDAAADLVGKLRLETIASSLRLPGAAGSSDPQAGASILAPRNSSDLDTMPRYGAGPNAFVPSAPPAATFFPPANAAWRVQQDQNRQ